MIPVADLYVNLRKHANCERTMSVLGRILAVYAPSEELATSACRSLDLWRIPAQERGNKPDNVCVVEKYSLSGIQFNNTGHAPSRTVHHPGMGNFTIHKLDDGSAVVQAGRGMLLCATTGEMVWLVDDALLAGEKQQWPNLTDLATILISEILRRGGYFLAHAGGVGYKGRCVLLTGESGSGKTTLTIRKVLDGWDFYGDDMVIVGKDPDGIWRAHPFWRPVNLTKETIELLGGLNLQSRTVSGNNKVQCSIAELADAGQPAPGLIEAVLCLQPGWHPKTLKPLSNEEALPSLGATFLSGFIPQNTSLDLENLLEFIAVTPVYQASWSVDLQDMEFAQ